ncbi:hypothetical protein OnM2_02502 [Erysiphe neolycopersici]|uniref:Uncharacterized protein n=1 Tax=Erysiphe neolycopersici TaxID=212602 RepID=A0A420HSY9_9PEZI|nr:hypothetical protein OnM2_02502 [Erysiphe neolycopersici]
MSMTATATALPGRSPPYNLKEHFVHPENLLTLLALLVIADGIGLSQHNLSGVVTYPSSLLFDVKNDKFKFHEGSLDGKTAIIQALFDKIEKNFRGDKAI